MEIIILKFILCVFIVFFFNACSTKVIIEPEVIDSLNINKKIYAKIVGKKTFVPNVIVEDENSILSANYSIAESYNISGKGTDVLNLFNPLLLVGFPMGDNLIIIISNLKLIKNEKIVKEYNSKCLHTYTRNLFGNPNFTAMRNKCLQELENNINLQIIDHIKKGELNEIQ
tara:strand:+ start:611 stop:1123 length:513 start_codon:yes stop_codon:yes gene_type:complete